MTADDPVTLRFCREGRAAHLRLNRPESMNAIDDTVLDALQQLVERLDSDDVVRVVTVRGAGGNFSAGADLDSLYDAIQDGDRETVSDYLQQLHDTLTALENLSVPTVALVEGYAFAGGLETALACDIILASESAVFGDQHAMYGLVAGGGGTQRLPRRIGRSRAKELIFTGRRLPAPEAKEWGLVNRVAEQNDFESAVDDLVEELASKGLCAAKLSKSLVDATSDMDLKAGLRLERVEVTEHLFSDDAKEGLAAFKEGREPDFSDP